MTDINNINNIARQIVTNLDKQDKKEDNKIEASIWNKFVCHKEGNEISNYITTDNALKSVITYLKREVAKTGQSIEDVANKWLKNVGGGDKTVIDETRHNKSDNDLTMKPIIFNNDDTEYSYKWLHAEEKTVDETQKQLLQKYADDATELLMDIANGNYRYKVKVTGQYEDGMIFGPETAGENGHNAEAKGLCENRKVELKDGREIDVWLQKQENGKWKLVNLNITSAEYKHEGTGNHDVDSSHLRLYNLPGQYQGYFLDIEPIGNDGYGDFDNMFTATKKNDTETIESLFKLAQKIFGDDIEV